ncbi:MAG TPA: TonB-dependent receptor [Gallionella sp.]|nr:TonB-dependent receptor [Gallionella sp.]
MKGQQVFALSVIALAVSHAVYAEVGTLPEVRVTSTTIDDRFDSKRGEPSNINNISGKKVDDEHGKNITEILDSIPGVTAELQSGDSVKIMLRGVEAQRYMGEKPGVAIVIDGVPVNERTGRVNIDLDNIDSIKVIKGGASYLFGEDALSGAVIITTKRGAKMAGVTASAEKGSFNYNKGLARVGFSKGDWVGHIQTTKAYADDYYDQGAYSRQYWDGKLQYLIDETSDISFGFEQSVRAKDSHGTVTGVTNAWLDPRSTGGGKDYARMYDVNLEKLNLNYAKDFGAGGNLMVATYQYLDHTTYKSNPSGILRTAGGAFLNGTSAASDMKNFKDAYASLNDGNQRQRGIKSEWRKGGERIGLMAGLDIRKDQDRTLATNLVNYTTLSTPATATTTLNRAGVVTANNVVTTKTNGLYGEVKWEATDPLTLTLNARYDDINAGYLSYIPLTGVGKSTSGQRTFRVWSERLGANYELTPDREIYANLSTGFRVPTATQLYGSTITPTGAVAANPNLKPEQALNQEIGLRAKSEVFGVALDMDVAVYQLDRKDFILNTGGQYQTSPTGIIEQYQNIGGVRNRGIELGLKTDAKRTWSGDVAYTYLDAVFTRNDTYWMAMGSRAAPKPSQFYNNTGHIVPRSPKHKVNLSTRYRATEALSFTAEVNAQTGLYADEVNVVWIGGRTVANLAANYVLKSAGGVKWSIFGRVDNLFDRFYYTTIRGGSDSDGNGIYNANDPSITVNPGRVWTAGLTLNF